VLAEDHGTYIMFPGGGIDDHETDIIASAIRELEEETHMTIS
jgi:8-oxo-dGTP pyrophosphatase MutT (NUDIX family)